MYDCQQDNYTDFATPYYRPEKTVSPQSNLAGRLIALQQAPAPRTNTLTQLLAWASEHHLEASLSKGQLVLESVSFDQALEINRLFGHELIISCHLRCRNPSHID